MPGMVATLFILWVRLGLPLFLQAFSLPSRFPRIPPHPNMRRVCWEPESSLQLRDNGGLDHPEKGAQRGASPPLPPALFWPQGH